MSTTLNLVLLVLSLANVDCSDEPCETTNIIDDWHRSTAYTSGGEDILCDSQIQEGWYRVTSNAGEIMPTQCVIENSCGTVHPIYVSNDGLLTGESIYPTIGVDVKRTAYANVGFNCKARSFEIQIKNCSLYYVYYLVKSGGCDLAYCFGDQKPCPIGETSSNGFTPGCSELKPEITLSPAIAVGEHEQVEDLFFGGEKKLAVTTTPKFSCHANDATSDYNYDISYYINEEMIPDAKYTNIAFTDISRAVLLQDHWDHTFKPNMLVKCSMQARFKNKGGPGGQFFSSSFFAGIKTIDVENGIRLNEGESRDIEVQITMPVGCRAVDGKANGCSIAIYNGVPRYQTGDVPCTNPNYKANDLNFDGEQCRLVVPHNKWNDSHFIKVTGKSDDIANRIDRIVFLRLYTPKGSASLLEVLHIWNKITLPDVKIYIQDQDIVRMARSCQSHNDPHMRIFDGIGWELQNSDNKGEYIMYRHERLPQQVNAYFRPCYSWDALCNCGVAIRSANSIFVANFCDTGPSHAIQTNRYIVSRMCDDQNLVVEDLGRNVLKITLPSGTTVIFSHGTMWNGDEITHTIYNIDITPSPLDYYLTSGLCGNYSDINGDDDFVSPSGTYIGPGVDFGKEWKVTTIKDSYFNPDGSLPPLSYKVQEYCTCNSPSNLSTSLQWQPDYKCELSDKMRVCRLKEIPKTVVHAKCISTTFSRKKRSLEDETDVPDMFPMTLDNTETTPEPAEWRNGLTENIARQKCEDSFSNRKAFEACKEYVPSVNSQQYIDECVADMKIAGSDFYLSTTIEIFELNCVNGASKMETLKETNTTDATGNSKTIFDVIAESVCPNNCSDRGVCKEGVCNCTDGNYGKDCSLNEKTPPQILPNAFRGKCDRSSKPCSGVFIPGLDFIPVNSTCKYRGIKVSENGTKSIADTLETTPGEYINSFQMKCNLPGERTKRSISQDEVASGFYISISNDGETYSEELTILIFDATCFECNTSSLACYKIDSCSTKPKDDENQTDNTVIGLAVGVIFLVIFIVVVLIFFLKKKSLRKQQIKDSFVSLPNSHRPMSSKSFLNESDICMRIKSTMSLPDA